MSKKDKSKDFKTGIEEVDQILNSDMTLEEKVEALKRLPERYKSKKNVLLQKAEEWRSKAEEFIKKANKAEDAANKILVEEKKASNFIKFSLALFDSRKEEGKQQEPPIKRDPLAKYLPFEIALLASPIEEVLKGRDDIPEVVKERIENIVIDGFEISTRIHGGKETKEFIGANLAYGVLYGAESYMTLKGVSKGQITKLASIWVKEIAKRRGFKRIPKWHKVWTVVDGEKKEVGDTYEPESDGDLVKWQGKPRGVKKVDGRQILRLEGHVYPAQNKKGEPRIGYWEIAGKMKVIRVEDASN